MNKHPLLKSSKERRYEPFQIVVVGVDWSENEIPMNCPGHGVTRFFRKGDTCSFECLHAEHTGRIAGGADLRRTKRIDW